MDMGIAGKVRPCLLLTDYPADDELAMVTVPRTRRPCGETVGAGDAEAVPKTGRISFSAEKSVSVAYLLRRLGRLGDEEWKLISEKLRERFAC